MRESVSAELSRLRSVLKYNRKTGEFIWRVKRNSHAGCVYPGDVAGTTVVDRDGDSHVNIGVNGKVYRAHRLAYLFVKGVWPKGDIDHKDGVRTHNWWTNLRPATRSQNMANNHKLREANVSGKTGVSWVAQCNKWMSRITVEGRLVCLGLFARDKLTDAIDARRAAELKYCGEYAPTEIVTKKMSRKSLNALADARRTPKVDSRSSSGKTGVNWVNRNPHWSVTIHIDGRSVYIAQYPPDQLAEAISARRAAELKHYGRYLTK
jgi:hypothetical protein